MTKKIPILLITHDRAYLLFYVLERLIRYTDWDKFELWILDNNSTRSNKKIIDSFLLRYSHIKVYSTNYNQVSQILNESIQKIKADIYIKLDDDILVSKNWTDGFIGVYERNYKNIGFGSVIIPINGFGWLPFLEIMNYKKDLIELFPNIDLVQECVNVPVWKNKFVAEFIWDKCLPIDKTTEQFIKNQNNNFTDLICRHRYSIGAIVFSHDFWDKMGGWKVDENFIKRLKYFKLANNIEALFSKLRSVPKMERLREINRLLTRMDKSALGIEEAYVFQFCKNNGYTIPVTTESIVYHFAFHPIEAHLMKSIYPKIILDHK